MIRSPEQIRTMDMIYVEVVDDSLKYGDQTIQRKKAVVWQGLWGPHGNKNYFWKKRKLYEFPFYNMNKTIQRTQRQINQDGLEGKIINEVYDSNLILFNPS